METLSKLLALCEENPPVTGGFPSQGQWRRALMVPVICAWTSDWTNNREAGDLRRRLVHYGSTVMTVIKLISPSAAYMCQWIGLAITETNAGVLLIRPLGTNFSIIRLAILSFSFKKMHLKLSSAKTATILSRVKHTSQLKYREVPHWFLYDGGLGFSRL